MAGFVLLQIGITSNSPSMPQLAVAQRGADHTANRGGGRTQLDDQAIANALIAASQATTTTVAPTTTTTAPPPTTTTPPTTARKVSPPAPHPVAAAPAPASGDTGVTGNDVWARLAMCESGGRNYSKGPYYGYFQFSPGTWASLGGAGLPSSATYAQQKQLAIALQARSGWGQWPVCSRTAGAV